MALYDKSKSVEVIIFHYQVFCFFLNYIKSKQQQQQKKHLSLDSTSDDNNNSDDNDHLTATSGRQIIF
jgi:hypothetical protein